MKRYFEIFGHTCELIADENLDPRREWFREIFIEWTTVDPTSNLTLQHFNSHSTIVNEREFHLANHRFTIHPFSRFKGLWETFITVVLLYALIRAPLRYLSFVSEYDKENIDCIESMVTVKLLCIIDMALRFIMGHVDHENFAIVLCKRKIAKKYLRGLFTFDFLINVPFFVGIFLHFSNDSTTFHFIRLLSFFRIFRLPTFVRYGERILLRLGVDDKWLEVLKLLSYWIICIHWAACLHILPGLIAANFRHDSNGNYNVKAWFEREAFKSRQFAGKYAICLFKSVKTFMGTGYIEDLQPIEYFDKIFTSLLTIIGRIGLCVTLAYIFQLVQGVRSSTLRYDEMMVQLNKYTDYKKLPQATKAKLKKNYDFFFRKRYFNERQILKTVSATLRQQILVHNTRQLVEKSPFFENLPSNLVLKIISALSVELYLEDDVIYELGAVGTSAYFISSGSVAFYSPSGKEVSHFSDGDYFGEATLVSDAEHQAHHYGKAVALETTKCYKLEKSEFQKLVQSFPDLRQKVEALTIERIEKVLTIEEREKNQENFRYASINQRRFPNDRRSANF